MVIKQSSPPSHDIFVNRSKPFLPPVTKRRFCNKVKPPSGRAESFYQISTIEAGECFVSAIHVTIIIISVMVIGIAVSIQQTIMLLSYSNHALISDCVIILYTCTVDQ